MQKLQRWYKGFSYRGNLKQLVEQISNQVQEHNLSKVIPLLRIEKNVNPRKQFYFFLAIESAEKGEIPIEISQSYLLKLNYFKNPIHGAKSFNYEEIKSMVGIAHDVHDYTHNIPYKPKPVAYDNPFDFISSSTPSSSNNNFSRQYERLLYWLSALGAGSWDSFKKACQSLELPEPRRIVRRLKLLGHLELSVDGSKWSMSPTALVKVNSQSENKKFILCGQRSHKLLQKLEQFTTVTPKNNGDAPPCIHLDNLKNVSELIEYSEFYISDVGNASSKLAEILPNIDTWQQNLRNLQGIVPSLYEWQYFDGHNFVDCVSPKETGLYQYKREANNNISGTVFYDQPNNKWLQGDWYGLRLLALHNQDISVHYDKTKESLAIPLDQRWPEIYERALVLASGLLPQLTTERWLVYERISLELSTQLTDKLTISLQNND